MQLVVLLLISYLSSAIKVDGCEDGQTYSSKSCECIDNPNCTEVDRWGICSQCKNGYILLINNDRECIKECETGSTIVNDKCMYFQSKL